MSSVPESASPEPVEAHDCADFIEEHGSGPDQWGTLTVWDHCTRCGHNRNFRQDSVL